MLLEGRHSFFGSHEIFLSWIKAEQIKLDQISEEDAENGQDDQQTGSRGYKVQGLPWCHHCQGEEAQWTKFFRLISHFPSYILSFPLPWTRPCPDPPSVWEVSIP
jgi:hypothetical protein